MSVNIRLLFVAIGWALMLTAGGAAFLLLAQTMFDAR